MLWQPSAFEPLCKRAFKGVCIDLKGQKFFIDDFYVADEKLITALFAPCKTLKFALKFEL